MWSSGCPSSDCIMGGSDGGGGAGQMVKDAASCSPRLHFHSKSSSKEANMGIMISKSGGFFFFFIGFDDLDSNLPYQS